MEFLSIVELCFQLFSFIFIFFQIKGNLYYFKSLSQCFFFENDGVLYVYQNSKA